MLKVLVKKFPHFRGELPSYQTLSSSGFDVRACLKEELILNPGDRALVPTGLGFEIPKTYEIQVRPRSGWALRHGVSLLNSPGTIDADYRGEVKVILINLGQESVTVQDQDRIAQLVLCPVVKVDLQPVERLTETQRGTKGFGSTQK